jgi:hypothetical protein
MQHYRQISTIHFDPYPTRATCTLVHDVFNNVTAFRPRFSRVKVGGDLVSGYDVSVFCDNEVGVGVDAEKSVEVMQVFCGYRVGEILTGYPS